jgi:hypothetical protein
MREPKKIVVKQRALRDKPTNRDAYLYFPCVFAIKPQDQAIDAERKAARISVTMDELKSYTGSRSALENFLKQFDDPEILNTF